jgi:hypothetical protein
VLFKNFIYLIEIIIFSLLLLQATKLISFRNQGVVMARCPRLLVPGLPLHIIQRGNNRSVCFYSEDD